MTRKRLATSFMTKAEVKSIRQFALGLEMHRCPRLGSRHLPSGCFGMQVQHQTSTHAGNILSSYGNPCKLDPCPNACYLYVLAKWEGKETWALPEILPKLWKTIWQRKAVWKTLFQNKSSGTINPVYLPHKTPEQHKECVNQQNTVYHKFCPRFLSCKLRRNIP